MLTNSIKDIIPQIQSYFKTKPVEKAWIFGSYSRGEEKPNSDVDILISTKVSGLRFYEITEALREALHKRVDLLEVQQLSDNRKLTDEVLKYGVRIYG